ncbi:MAG: asparagine synthase (glutamine-hydrolyzing) [Sinimarinibacterium sp.]|jgi:asparagine synthase (glutamine-hydrolysing)
MCGIAGMVLREGTVAEADLQRMAATLRHRGPEDIGTYVAGRFGIAHTRLAIIDVAGGHQPLFDAQKRYALVCNGEIYNYVELRAELEALGAQPLTHSDSEVALHGYAHWGRESFKRLNGMYACALYDHTADELWLLRDRLGIKPLYIARLPDRILFASELKALVPMLPQRRVHADALAQFFQNQHSSGRPTILEGVERVPPGVAIRIDADLRLTEHRYWSATDVAAPRARSFEQAAEEWEALFDQVLVEHMRSDVPYGVFLSGGVDSAVILGQLARRHTQPVKTFSMGWADHKVSDELDDAGRIAQLFGAEHHAIELDPGQLFGLLPRTFWAADDLMRDYACVPVLALAAAAAKELKVVFSGEGGDEAFAGYGRYRPDPFSTFMKRLRYPGSGGFRVRPESDPHWARRVFKPEMHAPLQRFRVPVAAAWGETPSAWTDLQRRQYVDLTVNLPDDLLVKADRMLMAQSLEGRVPFVDHRVVEFGLGLPDKLKVHGRAGKYFLKKWAENFVPSDHLWRKKRGFHVPVGQWFKGALLDRLAVALPASEAIREWCRPDEVKQLIQRQQVHGDVSRELWSLMQFAIWHRMFIQQPGAAPGLSEDPLAWI